MSEKRKTANADMAQAIPRLAGYIAIWTMFAKFMPHDLRLPPLLGHGLFCPDKRQVASPEARNNPQLHRNLLRAAVADNCYAGGVVTRC
jgi:hypothetical protein